MEGGFGELFGGLGEIFGGVKEALEGGGELAFAAAGAASEGDRDGEEPIAHERYLAGGRRPLNINDI